VLERLLSDPAPFRLEVVADRSARRAQGTRKLPGRYRLVPRAAGRLSSIPALRELFAVVNTPLALLAGVRGALAARAGPACVMSVMDAGFSQIAGAVASRLAGVPHLIMVFDLWEENAHPRFARWLARRLERRLLRDAAAVIVYCPQAAEHYRNKHAVECRLIATPAQVQSAAPEEKEGRENGRELLIAGAVYWMQEDAVRRVSRAAKQVEGLRVSYVGDPGSLRARGIEVDSAESTLPSASFSQRLAQADLLFMGLSLVSAYPAQVRISTPARLVDYMASERSMLIHAPAGSYVAEYAREEDFAEVVDEPSEDTLASAMEAMLSDSSRADARAQRARRLVLERHDPGTVRAHLHRILADALS
jgi:hypothetical protein